MLLAHRRGTAVSSGPTYHCWLIALLVIFWQLLRQAGPPHPRDAPQQLRAAVPQPHPDQLAHAAAAGGAGGGGDEEPLSRQRRARHAPAGAGALALRRLAAQRARTGAPRSRPRSCESTHAVNALFDSLFDLARIDSGQVRLHIERVDVAQLLHDLELQYRPVAEAKGLSFRMHVTPGTVLTDPIRVRRMIGNLLANAIKYTQPRAASCWPRGRRATACASRCGTPASASRREHLRDVFLEFYKVADHAGTVRRLRPGPGHRRAPVARAGPSGQRALAAGPRQRVPASRCTTPTSPRPRRASRAPWAEQTGPRAAVPCGRSQLASQQAVGARVVQRLGAALHAQAAEQAPQVHLDGVLADVELGRRCRGCSCPGRAWRSAGSGASTACCWRRRPALRRSVSAISRPRSAAASSARTGRLLDVGVGAGLDAGFFHVGRGRGRVARRSARPG